MKHLTYILTIGAILFPDISVAQDSKKPPEIMQCRKLAKPTWDKGGSGNLYMGNDVYRTCLVDQIQKQSHDLLSNDRQTAFLKEMNTAVEHITQAYSILGDQVDNAGHRKALDQAVDSSDLSFYEGLLETILNAASIMKIKEPASQS